MTRRFSVVVPVLNQQHALPVLLRCLEAQTCPREAFDCVIVNDGSTDATGDILARGWNVNLSTITHPRPRGRAAARNAGWRASRGDIVVFLDSDVLPCPEWLVAYDAAFATRSCTVAAGGRFNLAVDPRGAMLERELAALAGVEPDGLFRDGDLSDQFAALHRHARPGQYPTALCVELDAALDRLHAASARSALQAYDFVTCNAAVRRHALIRAGGFDGFLRRNQDIELGLRLWENGCRWGLARAARGYHLYHESEERWLTPAERLAFLWRHPYKPVLAMYHWMLSCSLGVSGGFPSVDALTGMPGREATADGALEREVRRMCETLLPDAWRVGTAELVELLERADARSPASARRRVARIVGSGLLCVDRGGAPVFDFHVARNWLDARASTGRAAMRSGGPRTAKRVPPLTGNGFAGNGFARNGHPASWMRCTGVYDVRFSWRDLNEPDAIAIDLPLPIATRDQELLRLERIDPGGGAAERPADVVRSELRRTTPGESVVRYAFECRMACHAAFESVHHGGDPATPRDLEPTYEARALDAARQMLGEITGAGSDGPSARARGIHAWMLERFTPYSNAHDASWILQTGLGDDVQMARLFVNLCRLAGLPARERCGARLAPAGAGVPSEWTIRSVGRSPWTQTWAEVYTDDDRWLPATFHVEPSSGRAGYRAFRRRRLGEGLSFVIRAADRANSIRTFPAHAGLSEATAFLRTHHSIACRIEPS
jgi:GT2 family glycosyltransferase